MATEKLFFLLYVFFVALLTMGINGVNGVVRYHLHRRHRSSHGGGDGDYSGSRKLFVFGDSYADTGNLFKDTNFVASWRKPYGSTFPGKPTGRFSDGRVFTDFVASFLRIRSPIPYKYRRYGRKLFRYGMNFAVGGSGVFDTYIQNNLTAQIDVFEELVGEGVFSGLGGSTAMVVISGNDYSYYQENGGTMQGMKAFTEELIEQLKSDLKRIHEIGVGKVAATNLHPLGCTPDITQANSYTECNVTVNGAVVYHNELLSRADRELNQQDAQVSTPPPFAIIDLFDTFMSILKQEVLKKRRSPGLKPCCEGLTSSAGRCGSEGDNGEKLYSLCEDRNSTFYWDTVHPTQAGWEAVYSHLRPSLHAILT